MFQSKYYYFGYKKNFYDNKTLNSNNFLFSLYDVFFLNKFSKREIFKKKEKTLIKDLYEKNKIPYREREPSKICLSFENIFDIFLIHEAYRIKCSINDNEQDKWREYIEFLSNQNIFNKYPDYIISKDCINYLNYIKNNTSLEINFIKLDSQNEFLINKCDYCEISFLDESNLAQDTNYLYCNSCGMIIDHINNNNDFEENNYSILENKTYINNDTNDTYKVKKKNFSFSSLIKNEETENDTLLSYDSEEDILNFSFIDLNNFTKRLVCFQGNQENKPPDKIIENLRTFLDNNKNKYLKGKTCEYIKNLKNNDERRKIVSLRSFEKLLKETKENNYIKDIEYISNKLFGWELYDLKDLQLTIIKDYIEVQQIYNKNKKRDSNLNLNIRLLFHLSLVGIFLDKKDLKLIKSKDSIDYHKKSLKEISKVMNRDISPFLKILS